LEKEDKKAESTTERGICLVVEKFLGLGVFEANRKSNKKPQLLSSGTR